RGRCGGGAAGSGPSGGRPMTLATLLHEPRDMAALRESDWDEIIPQARGSGLLSRLAAIAEAQGSYTALPERPRRHPPSAELLAAKHRRDVLYELDRIYEVIGSMLGTIVLLKGAAYLAAGLPPSQGRIF